MLKLLVALLHDRKGATAVEYGLILALIVLAAIVGVTSVGTANRGVWTNVSTKVDAATPN